MAQRAEQRQWGWSGARVVLASIALALAACAASRSVEQRDAQPVEARAPTATAAPLDLAELLAPLRNELKLPGLAAAVVSSDAVLARGAVGERRAGRGEAALADDLWHLGSCTKAMTATLVARLVEAGHLHFDQPVLDVLVVATAGLDESAREHWADLTLELLLQNRSGLGSPHDDRALWGALWQRRGTPTEQRAHLTAAMLAAPPAQPLGTYLYSNANCAIAGHVAEVVLGRSYEELMVEFVFEPLEMHSAGFDVPWDRDLEEGAAATQPWPHNRFGLALQPGPMVDNPPSIAPAGTVHASLADWGRFVALHLAGARGEATTFLSSASFERLHRAAAIDDNSGYAAGWLVVERTWARGRCLTHSGSNNSWFAVVWIAPELDRAVLVTTNAGGGSVGRRVDRVVGAIIDEALQL